MTALEALRMAVQGLISNRLRTLLTMLGITIGVASVIVLVAVGHGSAVKVNSQIESLGTNTLTVTAGGGSGFGGRGGPNSTSQQLTLKDAAGKVIDSVETRRGAYADSVTLMQVSQGVAAGPGVSAALVAMATELNLDLARAMQRAGWNVLAIHYRGVWGAPGQFSFNHTVEDARAALAWLRDPARDRCQGSVS